MAQRAVPISTRRRSAGTNTLSSPVSPSPSTIAGVSSRRVTIDAAPANIAELQILTRYPANQNEQGKQPILGRRRLGSNVRDRSDDCVALYGWMDVCVSVFYSVPNPAPTD